MEEDIWSTRKGGDDSFIYDLAELRIYRVNAGNRGPSRTFLVSLGNDLHTVSISFRRYLLNSRFAIFGSLSSHSHDDNIAGNS